MFTVSTIGGSWPVALRRAAIRVGDRIVFSPTNKTSTVKSIERWNAPTRDSAAAGESIGITLTEQIFVARGAVAALETAPPYELSSFKARLFWLGKEPFRKGRNYKLKLATQEVECGIESIERVIDASTLNNVVRADGDEFVGRHEVGELIIHTENQLRSTSMPRSRRSGRFVIVDRLDVSGRRHHRRAQLSAPHA